MVDVMIGLRVFMPRVYHVASGFGTFGTWLKSTGKTSCPAGSEQ
jgi:hypothetical protein